MVLYCIVLYCIVLYCIVLYCIVLYCIVLYCIVLYCIVLYCIVLSFSERVIESVNKHICKIDSLLSILMHYDSVIMWCGSNQSIVAHKVICIHTVT
jgi:hypothetical protein